jgi:methylmalonyl-CoA mutase
VKPSAVTLADWRAQVEKELAGVAFDKALVHTTPEGLAIQPLYTETSVDSGLPGAAPFTRGATAQAEPFQICMRVDPAARRRPEALAEDVDGGADALWLDAGDDEALEAAIARRLPFVVEAGARSPSDALVWLGSRELDEPRGILAIDPVGVVARGSLDAAQLPEHLAELGRVARTVDLHEGTVLRVVRVSSLSFHAAGADSADELALVLSTGVAYLRALLDAGLDLAGATRQLSVQISVGRDTFGELCKLRALRLCWYKLLAAAGAPEVMPPMHAVCSSRTQSQHDPWVNMLRVTTQVFAAAIGGAQMITPLSFDEALGPASAHGRRVARNAALVLREESHLGRVLDAAGGAYYLETRTDELAREAWSRFTQLERDGGIVQALTTGTLRARLEAAWATRAAAIARRKEPVLGVSEFANVDESLPAPVPPPIASPAAPALHVHRDAEAFDALRGRVAHAPREVALVTLGPPAEHRARAGYAAALFATAGLRTHETTAVARVDIACLCGSDERYAAEAAALATELRAAGCRRIVLAGRPGALEPALREAGVDTFIFVGCDVLATLTDLVGGDP